MIVNSPSDVPSAAPLEAPPEDVRRYHLGVLKWGDEVVKESDAFLRVQSGYSDIDQAISTIMGEATDALGRPSTHANLSINQYGKIGLDLKAAECDIKPFFEYKVSNKRFEQQSQMGQKLAKAWWTRRFIGMRMNEILSYANVAGTGYSHHIWN